MRGFIRRRVPDPRDAEDILQDVFSALVEANRLLIHIDHVTGWLLRVARNRITDLFRGGFGLRGSSRSHSAMRRRMADRMAERWEQMTPEERDRFRQRIRERCHFGPATSEGTGQ